RLTDAVHGRILDNCRDLVFRQHMGHLSFNEPGRYTINPHIMRRERLCATARQSYDARLGRRIVNLHLPGPQRSDRGQGDNPAKTSGHHLILDGKYCQISAIEIYVDGLAPDVVAEVLMILDIADRAAMNQEIN